MSIQLALQRPADYYQRSPQDQWAIDKRVGILDWEGDITASEMQMLLDHHRNYLKPKTVQTWEAEIERLRNQRRG